MPEELSINEHGKRFWESVSQAQTEPHIKALGKIGTPEAFKALIENGLTHDNSDIHVKANVKLLGTPDKAVKALIKYGLMSKERSVALSSMIMLSSVMDLKKISKDIKPETKREAVEAIFKHGLNHKQPLVRSHCILSIGWMGDKKDMLRLMKEAGKHDTATNIRIKEAINEIQEAQHGND